MKAVLVDGDALVWGDADIGAPGPGEVLIANRASAVNRADLAQRAGGYPPPPGASEILGLECAGVVESVGEGVTRVEAGDRVCALLAGGGYAEQVVAPAGQVLKIPGQLSFTEAAALPEVFATAYLNLFVEGTLQFGETALLHAGASGVGTAGIQLCREFGSPCFVTAGSDHKIARCVELGAAGGANRHTERFVDKVPEWTEGDGLDVILDPVGAAYLKDNLRALKADGRLVIIGLLGGADLAVERGLGLMMMKRLRIVGSTLRARSIARKAAVMDALKERVWPAIAEGRIRPVIEAVVPMPDADSAHRVIAGNETFGKVVLEAP
ncbi:MAG: NAD(P)H-quinone oxidoreductase [Gammaproteobacteria bacterium]|nr:NAD(P)H-quinone oxidoreductase [Gammaproteobacteria bacterium]